MSQAAASTVPSGTTTDVERAPGPRLPRFAEQAVDRARLSLVRPGRAQAPLAPFAVLLFVLLVAGVAGLLGLNTTMQSRSFTATRLQTTADRLSAQQQSLQIDLDDLGSPQTLAVRARALGMVQPLTAGFVELAGGRVVGDPQPATPDQAMRITPLPAAKPKVLAPAPKVVKVQRALPRGGDRAGVSVTDDRADTTQKADGGQR